MWYLVAEVIVSLVKLCAMLPAYLVMFVVRLIEMVIYAIRALVDRR